MNCSMTGRKWRYKRAAGGARAPPCPFPAVCPCEAGCAGFPAMWHPLLHQAPETALSRPVRRVCGEGWKMPDRRNEGRMGKRKRCRIKQWRLLGSPANHTVPQRGSGQRVAGFRPRRHFRAPAPLVAPVFVRCPPAGAFAGAWGAPTEILNREEMDTECLIRCVCICG